MQIFLWVSKCFLNKFTITKNLIREEIYARPHVVPFAKFMPQPMFSCLFSTFNLIFINFVFSGAHINWYCCPWIFLISKVGTNLFFFKFSVFCTKFHGGPSCGASILILSKNYEGKIDCQSMINRNCILFLGDNWIFPS